MQSLGFGGILVTDQKGFLACPYCSRNKKLKRVWPDEEARNLRLYCRECKREVKIDIRQGQCFQSQSRSS